MDRYKNIAKSKRNEAFLKSIGFQKSIENNYQEETVEAKKRFLIICEGKNTETYYFRSFPIPAKRVVTIGGKGSKRALVKFAEAEVGTGKYDGWEIWCVFDYDVKPDEKETQANDFNSSILKAAANGFNTAWSNDCFELWMLLHFDEVPNPLHRTQMYSILEKKLGIENYEKTGKQVAFCKRIYQLLGGNKSQMQDLALRRAKKLNSLYLGQNNYASQVPCTTVHLLVESLNSQF